MKVGEVKVVGIFPMVVILDESRLLMISNRNYIYQYDIDRNRLTAPIFSPNILAIDFDWTTRKLYYADVYYGFIYSTFLNRTDNKKVQIALIKHI